MRARWLLPAAAVLVAAHALPAAAETTWRAEAGLVIASGNTDTKAGNAKVAVKHEHGAWTELGSFNAVYASDEDGTTAQRWEAGLQANYQWNTRDYWFGGLRYESDRFSGFRYQGTASTGVGRKFFDTEETLLTAQIGVGYKFSETRDVYSPLGVLLVPGSSEDATALIGNVDFRRALTASTTLLDKFTVEYTSDNTFLQNELSLQVSMSERLSLAVGYAIRHNTDPPPGFDKTDTLTTVNVVYEVK